MRKVAGMQIRLPAVIGVRGMDAQAAVTVGEGPPGCGVGGEQGRAIVSLKMTAWLREWGGCREGRR
jgi:hypothetical protein